MPRQLGGEGQSGSSEVEGGTVNNPLGSPTPGSNPTGKPLALHGWSNSNLTTVSALENVCQSEPSTGQKFQFQAKKTILMPAVNIRRTVLCELTR